jgi:hypothetical protein
VEERLRDMLQDPRLSELLRLPEVSDPATRVDRTVKNIYDSDAWYQHVVLGKGRDDEESDFGRSNNRRNIVLSVNIDGFQPFDRAHSITPLVCQVLNLPENMRHQSQYLILAGLIPGPSAPKNQNAYLEVLVDELLRLWTDGFTFVEPAGPNKGKVTRVRVKLLFTCADYPAHGKNNCQQVQSAKYGCIKCVIQVRSATAPRHPSTFVDNC